MRRSLAVAVSAAVGLAAVGTPAGPAAAAPSRAWAPAASATIHPGIRTDTGGAGCTANFVYTDSSGSVYLGQAAHCSGADGQALAGSGCTSASRPIGTPVTLVDSGVSGTLAYSSWLTMQQIGEKDAAACQNNDFALIRIPAAAVPNVNPSLPSFGGPVGVAHHAFDPGASVVGYGNSNLRGGIAALSPQRGVAISSDESGWYHLVYLLLPGVPGDSGGGYLDADGKAIGELVSLNTVPPGSNGLTDIGRALAYAQAHSGLKGLRLEPGTEPFTG